MTDFFTAHYEKIKQKRAKERQKQKLKSIAPHLELLDIERAMTYACTEDVKPESRKQ